MRLNRIISTAAIAVAAMTAMAQRRPATLNVGDSAPPIEVGQWLKGQSVTTFLKGHIYVVECWATWCGPCRESIPHLTELHHRYGNAVTFVGVSVWENDSSQVAPFVTGEGSLMDYNVATDSVSGANPNDGFMATFWMRAAGRNTIPSAFLIDRDGKIAWIGHPMELEHPLRAVLAEKWHGKVESDPLAAKAARKDKADQAADNKKAELQALAAKFQTDDKAKNYPAAISDLDRLQSMAPNLQKFIWGAKAGIYVKTNDAQKFDLVATKFVNAVANDPDSENDTGMPNVMNNLAWDIVDPQSKLLPRDVDLALKASNMAVQATNRREAGFLDTLAWCYYWKGNKAQAADLENEAISKAMPADAADYELALKTFKK